MKKQLAYVLAASMLLSTAPTAFAAATVGSIDAEGSNKVEDAFYNYQIPKNLEFAIDPFEKGEASQVFSGTYPIINKSDVALSIKVSAKAVPKNDVTLKDSAAAVTQTPGYTDKEIYVEAVAAKTVKLVESGTVSTPHTAYEAPTVTKQPDSVTPSLTSGAAGTPGTKVKIAMNITGYTVTPGNTAAGGPQKKGAFTLVVKDADGNELFVVDSEEINDITAAKAISGAFASKKGVFTYGGESIELVAASSITDDTALAFEAAGSGDFAVGVDATSWTYELVPERGKGKDYKLDTAGANAPTYVAFNDPAQDAAIKDGANTRAKIVVGEAVKDKLWFVLKKATYAANFLNGPKQVLTSVTAADGAAGFRLMGAATPGAPWKPADVKIVATFDVSGVTNSSILTSDGSDKLTVVADGQRVYEQPAEIKAPSTTLDLKTVYGTGYTTTLDLPVTLGTQMKTVSKVEFRPAGTLKSATTWTAWAAANYTFDAETGKLKITVAGQKALKNSASAVTARGGIANFNSTTMEAENQLRITFSDGATTSPTTQGPVTLVIPVTDTTV